VCLLWFSPVADAGAAGPREPLPSGAGLERIWGDSSVMQHLRQSIVRMARLPLPVLILGETGTGKELVARALHGLSPRGDGPFVAVNCAAVPDALAETEFFGYEPGAFTGARPGGQPGRFERARGGTLFLDEIGEMPLALQAKILRVIQERELERVGGGRTRAVDVRLVAATNRDLRQLVEEGRFRMDLYHRLNVLTLTCPPLREHADDIPLIFLRYLGQVSEECGTAAPSVDAEALGALRAYRWPGNVRELQNIAQRLLVWHESAIAAADVRGALAEGSTPSGEPDTPNGTLAGGLAAAEERILRAALKAAGGNRLVAAKRLGIHRSTLYEKLERYHLS
jgi:transcriptional regulator with PAS, ATPase and Fis domain